MRPSHPARFPATLAILIGLLGAACGATEPLPSAGPGSDQPAAATSPSADSPARLGLSAFEARVRDATGREGQLVRALAAASAGTAAEMRLAVGQMRQWADGETAWLAAHPADACYDAAATKFQAAIDAMTSSADWFSGMVDASLAPSDDVSRGSMGTEAGNDLQDATQALADAAALAKAARASCT
jgi:hypothetical protein